MARTRVVYPKREIAHLWAHQAQPEARTSSGNFYYRGAVIYSYGAHFPIAMLVFNTRGERAVLMTTRTHSVTTASHCSLVRQAIPSSVQVFNISIRYDYRVLEDIAAGRFDAWIDEYQGRIAELTAKAARARTHKDWAISSLSEVIDEANAFLAYFDIKIGRFTMPTDFSVIRVALAKEAAEKAKAERERKLHLRQQNQELIEMWLAGDTGVYLSTQLPTYLRIVEDEVQTSRGASFPVTHAVRGLKLIRAVRESGNEWRPNGHTCHLGHYAIDRITPAGDVFAGCHHVKWDAIKRIADQLAQVKE